MATFSSPPIAPLDLAAVAAEVDASIDAAGLAGETTVTATATGLEIRSSAGAAAIDAALAVILGQGGTVRLLDPGEAGEATSGDPIDPGWRPILAGQWVDPASVRLGESVDGRRIQVDFQIAPPAAELFEAWTESHIGSMLVIELDGRVVSAPTIQSAIPGGAVSIAATGEEDAARLAAALRSAGGLTFRLQGP